MKTLLENSPLPLLFDFAFVDGELRTVEIPVCKSVDNDGVIYVSAESGDNAADYYGEFRGGDPWINPLLIQWAHSNHGVWEWINPGQIAFYQN